MKLRYKSDAPRRPPRIIIIGPPGSGRTTQCEALASTFGLVKVSMRDLLKKELHENAENAAIIAKCIDSGEPIPDRIMNNLVENRLKQSDCRVNGWVMEGFPENEAQVNLLKALRIKASTVFLLEQSEDESVRRLQNRKLDPETGIRYNMEINPPSDENIMNRLIDAQEDKYNVIKNRFNEWEKNVAKLEEHFKMVLNVQQSDRAIDQMTQSLCEAIQDPL